MVEFFVIVALVALAAGGLFVSQATVGVGLIAGACLFGIFAHIAQASRYQSEQRKWRETGNNLGG